MNTPMEAKTAPERALRIMALQAQTREGGTGLGNQNRVAETDQLAGSGYFKRSGERG